MDALGVDCKDLPRRRRVLPSVDEVGGMAVEGENKFEIGVPVLEDVMGIIPDAVLPLPQNLVHEHRHVLLKGRHLVVPLLPVVAPVLLHPVKASFFRLFLILTISFSAISSTPFP